MNYAQYAFDRAAGALFEQLDPGTTDRQDLVELLTSLRRTFAYVREIKDGERFVVETMLADADQKRPHLYQSP